jgi:flagellar biosynthetic protein FliP
MTDRIPRPRHAALGAALVLLAAAAPVAAQTALSLETRPSGAGGTTYSLPVQTMLAFAALSFLPAVLLLMTSFTRIVIVLSLLRQALGLQTTPPNQVIVGLSLFLTLFVMQPVLEQSWAEGLLPMIQGEVQDLSGLQAAAEPFRRFMLANGRESDLELFMDLAQLQPEPGAPAPSMRVMASYDSEEADHPTLVALGVERL